MPPKKDKNAGIFILDIGNSASKKLPNGETFLEEARKCLKLIIKQKIFTEMKDDYGLVLMGSKISENRLAEMYDDRYQKISLARELGVPDWDFLQLIESLYKPTRENPNWLDALIVALDHLHEAEETTVYASKQIVLFSNFGSTFHFEESDYQTLVQKIIELEIDILVIGTNLSTLQSEKLSQETADDTIGFAEMGSGNLAFRLLKEVGGQSFTFEEAVPQLMNFRREKTRHVPWNSLLEIGHNVKIAVSGYIKVKKADEVHWTEDLVADNEGQLEKERTYQKGSDQTIIVSKEDVIYGYRYGSFVVPFNTADERSMYYDAGERSMKTLQFTPASKVPIHLYSGNSTLYLFPRKTSGVIDQQAQVALSALIKALHETDHVIIVRRVYSRRSRAHIGILSPRIASQYECLVYHELPFADDIRHFEFPSIFTRKLQPKKEQLDAMDELIDSMDLMTADRDEEGNTCETLRPKAVINPHTVYLYDALAHRVLHPKDPLPDPDPQVAAILEPPHLLATQAVPVLNKIRDLFPLEVADRKRVEKAEFVASKRMLDSEHAATLTDAKRSKGDTGEDFNLAEILGGQLSRIGTATPVQDFNNLVRRFPFEEVVRQMQDVITQLLVDSGGNNPVLVEKCQDCLELLRAECLKKDPENYNTWLIQFKDTVIQNNFTEFWKNVVADHLGLITNTESTASKVGAGEAERFLHIETEAPAEQNEAVDEELLNLL